MNKRIAKLYDQAIVIEDGGDYVTGELDPKKFAELIVQECVNVLHDNELWNRHISHALKEHFGVEE